jgi:hypothetical protein
MGEEYKLAKNLEVMLNEQVIGRKFCYTEYFKRVHDERAYYLIASHARSNTEIGLARKYYQKEIGRS